MRTKVLSYCATVLLGSLSMAWPFMCMANQAVLLNVTGAIGPATQNYVEKGLAFAAEQHASLVILRIDTPGGLETAMHNIDKDILASVVPVAAYVSPTGARAASAGTFILYASPIAAMAPGTNIGAASPVNILAEQKPSAAKNIDHDNLTTLERKQTNDASANIRGLAQIHNRNAVWGETAVRDAASLSATEALKLKVIDVIATDIPDLLKQINGRKVIVNGAPQTLATDNLTVTEMKPDWRNQFLAIITDPNIAYILLLLGMYGLFFEFYHPGLVLPGVVGAISLLIALYAFQLLPINYVGFALLLLGIIFMIIEVLISSFGMLGIGGVVAFVMGSILLLDINSPGYQIAWSLIITMTIFTVSFFLLIVTMSVRAMRRKVVSGREAMIGAEGEVLEYASGQLLVRFEGEIWNATASMDLRPGQKVRVVKISGLLLTVEPLRTKNQPTSTLLD